VALHLAAQIGQEHRILMESPTMGRTEQFTETLFDRPQTEGQIVTARITASRGNQLIA
jgi:threonylcarbamoyladenosine tRNA methylthiotransferase MtaB